MAVNDSPALVFTGGRLETLSPLSFTSVYLTGGAELAANAPVSIGALTWNTWGHLSGGATVTIGGATLTGCGQTKRVDGCTLVNLGIVTQPSCHISVNNGGRIINEAGATWHQSGGWGFGGSGGSFINRGTYEKTDASNANYDIPFTNEGLINLQRGRMSMRAGGFIQSPTGTLRIHSAGPVEYTDYGVMEFSDPAQLDGSLQVNISFAAQTNHILDIIRYFSDPVTGSFASTNFTGFAGPDPLIEQVSGNPNRYRLSFPGPITPEKGGGGDPLRPAPATTAKIVGFVVLSGQTGSELLLDVEADSAMILEGCNTLADKWRVRDRTPQALGIGRWRYRIETDGHACGFLRLRE